MRLTIITLAVMATLAFPTPASADPVIVDEHGCPEGTTWTETAGVPLCLDPMWLDGTWNDDPRDCVYGYYQGTCAPTPKPPVIQPEVNYEFQMDPELAAAYTPPILALTPAIASAAIVERVVAHQPSRPTALYRLT